jgi:hypothetical protein
MGQHKTNPNSILKAQGLLKPKKNEKKPSRQDLLRMLSESLARRTGGKWIK